MFIKWDSLGFSIKKKTNHILICQSNYLTYCMFLLHFIVKLYSQETFWSLLIHIIFEKFYTLYRALGRFKLVHFNVGHTICGVVVSQTFHSNALHCGGTCDAVGNSVYIICHGIRSGRVQLWCVYLIYIYVCIYVCIWMKRKTEVGNHLICFYTAFSLGRHRVWHWGCHGAWSLHGDVGQLL